MIELAVIPAGAVRRCELQHRDPPVAREPAGLRSEPITDLSQQRRGRDRMPEMPTQEPHNLTGDLQPRHIRVEDHPVDALDLERHMTLEHIVDIRHARHPASMTAHAPRCHTQRPEPDGGGREGVHPLPLMSRLVNPCAVAFDGVEDLIRCLGPHERLGIFVPAVDPSADLGVELTNGAVCPAAQELGGQFGEPAFDQV